MHVLAYRSRISIHAVEGHHPKKPAITPIPIQLSETEFTEFILPHLSMPSRRPKCKLGYHCVFNLILWVLYTGMQWKCLPVPKAPDSTDAIHSRGAKCMSASYG